MRLAHLDDLENLVVPLMQQRVEIVPGARSLVGCGDQAVVDRDECEYDGHDCAEHDETGQHV